MEFSASLVDEFWKWYRALPKSDMRRLGQCFYDYFDLNKVTNPAGRLWADRLYACPDYTMARRMIWLAVNPFC